MEPTSFVVIYLIGYFFILLLAFAIPAAVIIVIAVKHKKEEEQKRFLFMQMMADIDRRNAEKAKESAQKPENEAQNLQALSLPSAPANTGAETEEKTK